MRWYIASIVAGMISTIVLLIATGTLTGSKSAIIIEFGMYPEEFEGLEVVIDEKPVGELRYLGAASRTGFEVKDGDHLVEVIHPELDCEPTRVRTTGGMSRQVVLYLDFASAYSEEEGDVTKLVFTR